MEDYNKDDRSRDDKYSHSDFRNFDMNWDRNHRPENEKSGNNKNVYSSDREKEYWNSKMNRYSNRNEHPHHPGDFDADWRQNNPYDFRTQRYNDNTTGYSHDHEMSDNYNRRSQRYRNENYPYFPRDERDWQYTDRGWWDKTKDEVASWFGDGEAEKRRRRDEMQNGPHRGKGPKNYTRSEERIKEDVSDQLSDDSFLDASGIEVSVKDGDVTLSGTVDSRYSKHRAEDLAEDVTGVKNVQNNLRVEENVENTINKNAVNDGNRPITSNTNYTTTKNRPQSLHG